MYVSRKSFQKLTSFFFVDTGNYDEKKVKKFYSFEKLRSISILQYIYNLFAPHHLESFAL